MSTVSRAVRTVLSGLSLALTLGAAEGFAAPPVLRWDPSVAGNAWNAAATNWLDTNASAVAWIPGAQAAFEDAGGGPVQVDEDVSATNLAFTGNGYTLLGAGRVSVEGTLSAAASTASRIDAELRSLAGLTKTGPGTLTLGSPNVTLTNPVAVSAGTLALQSVAIPAAVSVAAEAALTALPAATNGLTGFYYNVTPDGNNFTSLMKMEDHFALLNPDLVALSSGAGEAFDFGTGGALFPLPYGTGGTRTNNFEVVWRGVLTVPENTYYTFRLTHDDGFLLALDGRLVANRLSSGTTDATVTLDAGPHDMVLGLYQGLGPSGMKIQIKTLYGAFAPLPNAWLKPYTAVGPLSGSGAASLSAGDTFLNVAEKKPTTFSGTLAGPAGSLFTKSGWSTLTLASAGAVSNALAGGVAVQSGVLSVAAPERIGDTSTVAVAAGAGLRLSAAETLGALAGEGTVLLGGGSSVTVAAYANDADSGLSTNKTYTHLLDFPADTGTAATVNGVAFMAAGLNGSTNGYAWSTVNPPASAWTNGFVTGMDQLLFDFAYGSTDYTLTLSGLRPGQAYETRLYFRSFGGANPNSPRKVTFFFTAGAAFVGAVDHNPDTITRSWVSCRYTADAAGTLSVRVVSHINAHTCHLYGLSNEETPAPALPPPAAAWPRVIAFTGDADSGLSSAKTYTHKLDFPANGNPATVNGVTFTPAGMSGSAEGYAWSTLTPPTESWNSDPKDDTRTGVDRLLWDFHYNSADFTLTLSGLRPGQTYEARLYFRNFGTLVPDSPRDVTFTFTAGSTVLGSVFHDLDTIARSRVECRYTADAAGTVAIRAVAVNSGYTCHLYGLTNEEVNETPALTLDTPAGSMPRHTGAVTGYGTLVKRGAGTQRFGGANTLVAPVDVQAGTLALEAGASVLSGVVVRAGATVAAPAGDVRLGGLEGEGTFSLAGLAPYPVTNLIRTVYFTNDVGVDISSSKTYTHLLDFGTRAVVAVINGVTFNKVQTPSGSYNGYGFANFPPLINAGNSPGGAYGVDAASGVFNLLYDMDYGFQWPGSATMTLTGLVPGKRYEVRCYNRSWGWGGSRTQTLTFDPDGTGPISEAITFNPDQMYPNFIGYRYTAASPNMAITVQSAFSNQTYHLYGLSNEEVADAAYVPVTVDLARDCEFAGTLTGAGGWVKAGPATLTLTGTSDATGPVTVGAGTLAVDVSGTLGGDVTVASNALLRAGTAAACGSLAVGGDLTLAPGARLSWRYAAGASDLITVGGTLTFPAHGVLQVASFTAGLKPPAVSTVFISDQPVIGPADLSGWTVAGVENCILRYNGDRTKINLVSPRGTLILLQ